MRARRVEASVWCRSICTNIERTVGFPGPSGDWSVDGGRPGTPGLLVPLDGSDFDPPGVPLPCWALPAEFLVCGMPCGLLGEVREGVVRRFAAFWSHAGDARFQAESKTLRRTDSQSVACAQAIGLSRPGEPQQS
jgi:hypothetical protein